MAPEAYQPDEREALAFLVCGADRTLLGRSAQDAIIRAYGPQADAILAAGFSRTPQPRTNRPAEGARTVEWGVVADDLGSVDLYDSEAEARRDQARWRGSGLVRRDIVTTILVPYDADLVDAPVVLCDVRVAACRCHKPSGHGEAGDPVHECDPRRCTGAWTGHDGDFEVVRMPFRVGEPRPWPTEGEDR